MADNSSSVTERTVITMLNISATLNNSTEWQLHPICAYGYIFMCYLHSTAVFLSSTFILLVLSKDDRLHTSSNIIIGNLAAADALFTFMAPLETVLYVPSAGYTKKVSCIFISALTGLVANLNIASFLFIAVDRYVYIAHGIRYYTLLPESRVKKACLALWLIGSTYQIGVSIKLFESAEFETNACQFDAKFGESWQYLVPLVMNLGSLALGSWLYMKIGCIAHQQHNAINPQAFSGTGLANCLKFVKMMVMVTGVYILCHLQALVLLPLLSKMEESNGRFVAERAVFLTWRINAWINPFIYAWRDENFRRGIKVFFQREPE